jgi:leader peptidase (prepilin peptidase)/N-methyltransferase
LTLLDIGAVSATLFGACVGSFLNVCIHRIPIDGLSISRPRNSFCPKCRNRIRWYDNIPVLSWLCLGAKCRDCRAPISARYPAIELLVAGLFLALWVRSGPDTVEDLRSAALWGTLVFWCAVFSVMVVISWIDIDHRIIPDELSVTGGALALLVAPLLVDVPHDRTGYALLARALAPLDLSFAPAAAGAVQGGLALLLGAAAMAAMRRFSRDWEGNRRTWWGTRWAGAVGAALGIVAGGLLCRPGWLDGPTAASLIPALLGSAAGAGTIHAIGILGKWAFRKDAMGFGDVKLMGFLGAFLGPVGALLAIVLASFLGSVIGIGVRVVTRSSTIPFGPFLCAGAAILVLGNEPVHDALRWYLDLFQG